MIYNHNNELMILTLVCLYPALNVTLTSINDAMTVISEVIDVELTVEIMLILFYDMLTSMKFRS